MGLTEKSATAVGQEVVGLAEFQDWPRGLVGVLYEYFFKPLLRIRILFFSFDALAEKLFGVQHGYLALGADGELYTLVGDSPRAQPLPLSGVQVRKDPSLTLKGWYEVVVPGRRWPIVFLPMLTNDEHGDPLKPADIALGQQLGHRVLARFQSAATLPAKAQT